MATVHDLAAYILERRGPMTAMKLQKLVYYAQAWSLVLDDKPIFTDTIEAWANGPVVRALYEHHRGKFTVSAWEVGDSTRIHGATRETVDAVLRSYGSKSAEWLVAATHREAPWKNARRGLGPNDRCDRPITRKMIKDFYTPK